MTRSDLEELRRGPCKSAVSNFIKHSKLVDEALAGVLSLKDRVNAPLLVLMMIMLVMMMMMIFLLCFLAHRVVSDGDTHTH